MFMTAGGFTRRLRLMSFPGFTREEAVFMAAVSTRRS